MPIFVMLTVFPVTWCIFGNHHSFCHGYSNKFGDGKYTKSTKNTFWRFITQPNWSKQRVSLANIYSHNKTVEIRASLGEIREQSEWKLFIWLHQPHINFTPSSTKRHSRTHTLYTVCCVSFLVLKFAQRGKRRDTISAAVTERKYTRL